jgi:hypothetical protein
MSNHHLNISFQLYKCPPDQNLNNKFVFGSFASSKIKIIFVVWCRLLEYAVGQKTPGWKMQDVQQQALICNDKVPICVQQQALICNDKVPIVMNSVFSNRLLSATIRYPY